MVEYNFKLIETNQQISKRLYTYLLPRIKKGLKKSVKEVDSYYNDVFIDEMIEQSALVEWLRSEEKGGGRGFLGWTINFLENEIQEMKHHMKKQKKYILKNNILEINKIESGKLEEILKAGVKRKDWIGKTGTYTFIEPWYDWITSGYVATSSTGIYRIKYKKGYGFSGLAKMVDANSPEAKGSLPNEIKKIEIPSKEMHTKYFKQIQGKLISIVTKNIEMEISK